MAKGKSRARQKSAAPLDGEPELAPLAGEASPEAPLAAGAGESAHGGEGVAAPGGTAAPAGPPEPGVAGEPGVVAGSGISAEPGGMPRAGRDGELSQRLARARQVASDAGDAEAIGELRQLAGEAADDTAPRLALAELYLRRGEHVLALEQLDAARELAPDDPDVLLALASGLAAARRYDVAERELRRAQRLAPERWEIFQQLGVLNFKRGRYADAEVELGKSIELGGIDAASYFYRGESLNHLNRIDEALESLERAVQLDPRNGRAYFAMGILYDRKHLRAEAAAMYRKSREAGAA
jgi:Flp pilus assembly protein TadD